MRESEPNFFTCSLILILAFVIDSRTILQNASHFFNSLSFLSFFITCAQRHTPTCSFLPLKLVGPREARRAAARVRRGPAGRERRRPIGARRRQRRPLRGAEAAGRAPEPGLGEAGKRRRSRGSVGPTAQRWCWRRAQVRALGCYFPRFSFRCSSL